MDFILIPAKKKITSLFSRNRKNREKILTYSGSAHIFPIGYAILGIKYCFYGFY